MNIVRVPTPLARLMCSALLAGGLAAAVAGCAKAKPALPAVKPAEKAAPKPAPPPVVDQTALLPVEPCPLLSPNRPAVASPAILRCVEYRFHPVNQGMIDVATYDYYVKSKGSDSATSKWSPYNEDQLQADFTSLWKTNFLDNLAVRVIDEPFDNGVAGKHVIFDMEERSKLRGVDYTGSKEVPVSKIDEKLKEKGIAVRLDSFVDQATIRRVIGIIRDLYAEKGFEDAKVTTTMMAVAGGPKLVQLTFDVQQGPKIRIRQIVFDGNKDFSDKTLGDQMKSNKSTNLLSFLTGAGQYQEAKFADDALNIQDFYREHGYMRARVGTPQIERLQDSKDGKARWVRIRVPVDEGARYRMGTLTVTDNTVVPTPDIVRLFPLKQGDWVNWKKVGKNLEKLKEAYSGFGYIHFTTAPDLQFVGIDENTGKPIGPGPVKPVVNVLLKIVEGKKFFVNRITLVGNTTTHDTVARRELRLQEGGVFAMDGLKYSVRRLNQLGYFKPLESDDSVQIDEVPGVEGLLDLKLKVEEQNRNQISFGAGASAIDGFFGQLSFQTANFLGRGETLGVSLQKGSQARNYQVSFSEPFLFDRPITAGTEVFSRTFIYPAQYTQQSTGGTLILGLPLADFTRLFMGYSLEKDRVFDINPLYLTPGALASSPTLADSLLINQGGQRTTGKISPSVIFDTVRVPIFPDQGTRYTAAFELAGVGGNEHYWSGRLEGVWYVKLPGRTSIGLHAQGQYIVPYGATKAIPIFQKYFMGGEYSIRGFDLRSIGPRDPASGVVTGGNKTLLFNAEYVVNVGGPIRVLAFYDAGEVRDVGQRFVLRDSLFKIVTPPAPLLTDPFAAVQLTDPNNPPPATTTVVSGHVSAFKTSVGMEVRFFMPVLNVPFRLIFAFNPQRAGVLDNNFQLTKRFVIKFAVGTTF